MSARLLSPPGHRGQRRALASVRSVARAIHCPQAFFPGAVTTPRGGQAGDPAGVPFRQLMLGRQRIRMQASQGAVDED